MFFGLICFMLHTISNLSDLRTITSFFVQFLLHKLNALTHYIGPADPKTVSAFLQCFHFRRTESDLQGLVPPVLPFNWTSGSRRHSFTSLLSRVISYRLLLSFFYVRLQFFNPAPYGFCFADFFLLGVFFQYFTAFRIQPDMNGLTFGIVCRTAGPWSHVYHLTFVAGNYCIVLCHKSQAFYGFIFQCVK